MATDIWRRKSSCEVVCRTKNSPKCWPQTSFNNQQLCHSFLHQQQHLIFQQHIHNNTCCCLSLTCLCPAGASARLTVAHNNNNNNKMPRKQQQTTLFLCPPLSLVLFTKNRVLFGNSHGTSWPKAGQWIRWHVWKTNTLHTTITATTTTIRTTRIAAAHVYLNYQEKISIMQNKKAVLLTKFLIKCSFPSFFSFRHFFILVWFELKQSKMRNKISKSVCVYRRQLVWIKKKKKELAWPPWKRCLFTHKKCRHMTCIVCLPPMCLKRVHEPISLPLLSSLTTFTIRKKLNIMLNVICPEVKAWSFSSTLHV